jgi:hypothetical protein
MHSVSLYMPHGRAHRYTLDNITGTGEHRSNPNEKPGSTHVQYIQNHDTSTRSNPSVETGFNTRQHDMNAMKTNSKMDYNNHVCRPDQTIQHVQATMKLYKYSQVKWNSTKQLK